MALTKVSTAVVDMSGNTGALEIAKGTTATRPAAPSLGTLRANTTDHTMEVYASTGWKAFKEGGNAIILPLTIDFLVVAGGGGGAPGFQAGGGGAGGFRTSFGTGNINGGLTAVESTLTLAVATSYSVTIGAPGAGGAGSAMSAGRGATGSDSFFSDGNTTFEILTIGGGGGASYNNYVKVVKVIVDLQVVLAVVQRLTMELLGLEMVGVLLLTVLMEVTQQII